MANLPPSFYKFNKSYSTASQSTAGKGLGVPVTIISSSSSFTKSFSSRQVNSSTTFKQPFIGGQEFCVAGKKAPRKMFCKDPLCAVPECPPPTKEVSSDDESQTGEYKLTAPDGNSDASSKADTNSITSSTEDLEDAFDDDSRCTEGPIKKVKKENRPIEKEERQKWDAQSLKSYASSN